jgi:predicted RNase H-like HicB family nuclease
LGSLSLVAYDGKRNPHARADRNRAALRAAGWGGYSVYAPELPGLHTQGEDIDDALASANEAVALYVEGIREDGDTLDRGIVRRRIKLPVDATPASRPRSAPGQGA